MNRRKFIGRLLKAMTVAAVCRVPEIRMQSDRDTLKSLYRVPMNRVYHVVVEPVPMNGSMNTYGRGLIEKMRENGQIIDEYLSDTGVA